jgi:hypothetical protein
LATKGFQTPLRGASWPNSTFEPYANGISNPDQTDPRDEAMPWTVPGIPLGACHAAPLTLAESVIRAVLLLSIRPPLLSIFDDTKAKVIEEVRSLDRLILLLIVRIVGIPAVLQHVDAVP